MFNWGMDMRAEENIIAVKAENSGHFLFISEILNRPILSASGNPLGKLHDLKVRLDEPFPRIISLAMKKRREKKLLELNWALVESLDTNRIGLAAEAELFSGRSKPLRMKFCSGTSCWTNRSSIRSGPRSNESTTSIF